MIDTAATRGTFLMVFVLPNTQTRDSRRLHVKLDELLRAVESARSEIIRCSELSDEQLEALHRRRMPMRPRSVQGASWPSALEPGFRRRRESQAYGLRYDD